MTAFEHRGIVEGYYGKTYTPKDRLAWVRDIGQWGMNRYLYAPKDDPLHREHWRDPYPQETLDEFAALVQCGDEAGVRVGFAISPGLSIHYANDDDVEGLIAKFHGFTKLGSRFISLALDDVPTTLQHEDDRAAFENLAQAHVALAHRIKAELPNDTLLWLVPTDYIGTQPSDYLEEIGRSLDPKIEVAWTGRTIISPTITGDEIRARAQQLGRRLLIWDNVPVSDGPMRPMLHLGPYVGRDETLAEHASGILLNPMELPRASRLGVRTAADYLNAPHHYNAEQAWDNAAQSLGAGASEAYTLFARAHRFSPLLPNDRDTELEATFDRMRTCHADGQSAVGALSDLDAMLNARSSAASEIRTALDDRELAQELEPWLESYEAECLRMRIAVDLLSVFETDSSASGSTGLTNAMDAFFAFSRFEGRLTHVPGPIKASFGPRRVMYAQLQSLDDTEASFGSDPALFIDRCLADTFVRYAETRVSQLLNAKIAD